MSRAAKRRYPSDEDIIARLDIIAEYEALGVRFKAGPRSNGIAECFSRERDERKASAFVNTTTGLYCDKGGDGRGVSLWDMAIKYGGFSNYIEAKKHYEEKAGMHTMTTATKIATEKPQKNKPFKIVNLTEAGETNIFNVWRLRKKEGVSLESMRLAGAKYARWGYDNVIALPCYTPSNWPSEPFPYVAYSTSEFYAKDGEEPPKMKSTGKTHGVMMGPHALARLSENPNDIEVIWKTAGPSDMMALLSIIPPELRDTHLVLSNADGETGKVTKEQAQLFAGRKVVVVHDVDDAGNNGAKKWLNALQGVASEVRWLRLDDISGGKKGYDVRDFVVGGGTYDDLLGMLTEVQPWEPTEEDSKEQEIVNQAGAKYWNALVMDGEVIGSLTHEEVAKIVLAKNNGFPKSSGSKLFALDSDGEFDFFNCAEKLFGLLEKNDTRTWCKKDPCKSRGDFFAALPYLCDRFQGIERLPHFPPLENTYYLPKYANTEELSDAESQDLVAELLSKFCPETDEDKILILSAILTVFWGGAPSERPAFVITSRDFQGSGKSSLVAKIAKLSGDLVDCGPKTDVEKLKTRLLSPRSRFKRVVQIDNTIAQKLTLPEISSLITSPTVSGHEMFCGEGDRPNMFTWFFTTNIPSLSRDLTERCINIRLVKSKHRSSTWGTQIDRFIAENHTRLISAFIKFLSRPNSKEIDEVISQIDSRRGNFYQNVLCKCCKTPEEVVNTIKTIEDRKNELDGEAHASEDIVEQVSIKLHELGYTESQAVFLPSSVLSAFISEFRGRFVTKEAASREINQMISKSRTSKFEEKRERLKDGPQLRGYVFYLGERVESIEKDILERVKKANSNSVPEHETERTAKEAQAKLF